MTYKIINEILYNPIFKVMHNFIYSTLNREATLYMKMSYKIINEILYILSLTSCFVFIILRIIKFNDHAQSQNIAVLNWKFEKYAYAAYAGNHLFFIRAVYKIERLVEKTTQRKNLNKCHANFFAL